MDLLGNGRGGRRDDLDQDLRHHRRPGTRRSRSTSAPRRSASSSPRRAERFRSERARDIARSVRGRAELVGVFKEVFSVRAVHEAVGLDRAQIHVSGRPDVSLPILRAIRPEELATWKDVPAEETILIDGSEGRGLTFDWNLARSVSRPFVLAGGLSPDERGGGDCEGSPHGRRRDVRCRECSRAERTRTSSPSFLKR